MKQQETTGASRPNSRPDAKPEPQHAISLGELLAMDLSKEQTGPRPIYGIWTLADGREVLFDRDYRPLYSRRPGAAGEIAEPRRPTGIIKERFLWADRDSVHSLCPATRRKLRAILRAWGIAR